MRATVSVANSIALVETNNGCKTFSSRMLEMRPCHTQTCFSSAAICCLDYRMEPILTFLTLIPAFFSPRACLFRNSVTMAIGFNPAFSASVVGMTSSASAKAWKQYASLPRKVWPY